MLRAVIRKFGSRRDDLYLSRLRYVVDVADVRRVRLGLPSGGARVLLILVFGTLRNRPQFTRLRGLSG